MANDTLYNEHVSDALLAQYADLIYRVAGIRISAQKKILLSNRLRRRLRATGIANFGEYYRHLKKLRDCDAEWDAFLDEITTHETYLFRDEKHWEWLRKEFLPEAASQSRSGKRPRNLRFWSAACSTGDEAFSIASCLADGLMNHAEWSIAIVGTDIGTGVVEQARQGVFNERAMRLVPESMRRRFFVKQRDAELWAAKPVLSDWMRFQQHNLLEPLSEPPFDVVFLKNVLIYFDTDSKRKVVDVVRRSLKPGGYLVTSGAEGVSEMLKELDQVTPWLHRAK